MRYFISFQKKKALCLTPGDAHNEALAHGLNHELMAVGHVLSREAFDAVASLDEAAIGALYQDLISGIRAVVGGEGYEPIYRGFPQSVVARSYLEFAVNALAHYWSGGQWRPEDAAYLQREFAIEPLDYKPVGLMDEDAYAKIFTDLLYSNVSLSAFDKECLDAFIADGGAFDFSRITFKETAAYIGQRLLDARIDRLPVRRATTLLRVWSAYSGGDEGLKENTRYKNPRARQRAMLMRTLERCDDLEDSFKSYREKWLRLLFYLHPLTEENRAQFPRLAEFTERLRNSPKTLKTFNARVEQMISEKNPELFDLLARRPGAFMRRLDHLLRAFGEVAIDRWLQLDVRFEQLVTAYNHFIDRDREQSGRAAVLASQGQSELVTYKALAPLPTALVRDITTRLRERMASFSQDALSGAAYIDPGLYFTPLATNNRASSLALDGKPIGATERYTQQQTLRLYVHWEGKSDIDLSGFAIGKDNSVIKVGWNAAHHASGYIVYSGDNTGYAEKNAEYLDINTRELPSELEWIIVEARIYRGPKTFAGYKGTVHMGWMSREAPEANQHWLPQTLEHAMSPRSASKTAYLMAYHPGTQNIVYLDMAMGSARVSTAQDAIKMRIFLESFVTLDDGQSQEISWGKINQGHILHLLAARVVDTPEAADVVFDENTTSEQVSRLMGLATSG